MLKNYILSGRVIKPGQLICHRCDVKLCCNYERHLFAGSYHDNALRGERHWKAKLTWKDVEMIRNSTQTNRELAEKFGVKHGQIERVRNFEQWKEK